MFRVKSVGGYPPPETSVGSACSVGEPCASKASMRICEICGRNSEGGMAGMPYPPTKTPTDCTDVHRLGGKTQPKNP